MRILPSRFKYSARRGFTLIEVLVVVVIVAIMSATVAISFNGGDRDRRLRAEAFRLAGLLELTRNQAIQRNEEWGLFVDESTISFATFDETNREWVDWEQRPLKEFSLENIRLELSIDEQSQVPDSYATGDLPDLVFFSSGESQKYDLRVQPDWEAAAWTISSDGLSSAAAVQEER